MYIQKEEPAYIYESNLGISILNIKHYKAHFHEDALEIIFCLKGSVNIVIGARRITLNAGDIFTLDCKDIHCLYSDTENMVATVHINLKNSHLHNWDTLKSMFFLCSNLEHESYQQSYLEDIYSLLWSALYAYSSDKGIYSSTTFNNINDRIINIFTDVFSWPYKSDIDSENNEDIKNRLQSINRYVQENFAEKITAAEIAQANGLNVNYLSHFMKKSSYRNFKSMVAYIRCFNAENMLLTTDLSGQEISELCGFSSSKYFYKWFRIFFHTSPLQHKNWHKKYASEKEAYYLYSNEELTSIINSLIAEYYTSKILKQPLH